MNAATLKLLLVKAKAIASSLITILTGLAVAVTLVAPEIASWCAEGTAKQVIETAATIAAWLGSAAMILRNTVKALPSEQFVEIVERVPQS